MQKAIQGGSAAPSDEHVEAVVLLGDLVRRLRDRAEYLETALVETRGKYDELAAAVSVPVDDVFRNVGVAQFMCEGHSELVKRANDQAHKARKADAAIAALTRERDNITAEVRKAKEQLIVALGMENDTSHLPHGLLVSEICKAVKENTTLDRSLQEARSNYKRVDGEARAAVRIMGKIGKAKGVRRLPPLVYNAEEMAKRLAKALDVGLGEAKS